MRVTEMGAILTRSPVSRAHLYLAVMLSTDTLTMVVAAASQQACAARTAILEAFSAWGELHWPADPAEYWTNGETPVDEPTVSADIFPGVHDDWPIPLMEGDLQWSEEADEDAAEENLEGVPDWTHPVDLEPTESNDQEEEAFEPPDPPLSPIDEGAPPGGGDGAPQSDPEEGGDDGDDGEDRGGGAVSVAERVARALARRPAPPLAKQAAPPWRESSRPPLEPHVPEQGGSRQREAPPPLWASAQAPGRKPKGKREAQRARMGLSSSSAAGGPTAPLAYPALGSSDEEVRARLAEALRIAEEARLELERFAAAAHGELPTPIGAPQASGSSAQDRSRSAIGRGSRSTAPSPH